MLVEWVRRAARFRDSLTKRFVSKAAVLKLVDEEQARNQVRASGLTRRLIAEKISLSDYQMELARLAKESSVRMAALGVGGRAGLTPQKYGQVGALTRVQYEGIGRFGEQLYRGELTEKQAYQRAKTLVSQGAQLYHRGEKQAKIDSGFTEGNRNVDAQSKHCRPCLSYITDGWVPINAVVPVGNSCDCGFKCRCKVIYR